MKGNGEKKEKREKGKNLEYKTLSDGKEKKLKN